MPQSNFLFVQVQPTGKVPSRSDVRTAIQKHVMRDIGAARRGRTRPQRRLDNVADGKQHDALSLRKIVPWTHTGKHLTKDGHHKAMSPAQELVNTGLSLKVPFLISGGCRTDPFVCFPIQMTWEASFLIDHLLNSAEPRLQTLKETWLPLGLSDSGLFYEILSHISHSIPSSSPGHSEKKRAFALHSQALQSVNRRLSDPVASVSDGIIASIIGFACFSHSDRDWATYNMHMEGLRNIMKLRGGVQAINHNRILRLLLSGIDISASCFTRQRPKFPLPISTLSKLRANAEEIPWWFLHPSDDSPSLWSIAFPHDPTLVGVFTDLGITCMAIKSELRKRLLWQDQSFVKSRINPLSYRLLDGGIQLVDIDETNFIDECCRLGALILLSKIRRRFGARLVFTGVETERLRTLLELYGEKWKIYQTMLLWAVILAAVETEAEDRLWFCDLIGGTASAMNLQTWDAVMVHASNLLWVGEVLDKECESLRSFVHIV